MWCKWTPIQSVVNVCFDIFHVVLLLKGRKLPAETKGKPGCNCSLRSRQKTVLSFRASVYYDPKASRFSPVIFWHVMIIIITYMFGLTCDFPPRVSVSSSVLQEEITVGFVRNPKLERVFQHNFFRSNPHPHTHTRLVLLLFLVHTLTGSYSAHNCSSSFRRMFISAFFQPFLLAVPAREVSFHVYPP